MQPLVDHQQLQTRRRFFGRSAVGIGTAALATLLDRESLAEQLVSHFAPRAKRVIYLFQNGAPTQVDTFDHKPEMEKLRGTDLPASVQGGQRLTTMTQGKSQKVLPSIAAFKQHGESGIAVTDWWPHLAKQVDDICFVRNMWTTDNDHAAENQIHTGRHKLDETQPSIGAWAHYGLGSLNENLPRFVVLGGPTRTDTRQSIDSYYLGPAHAGVPLKLNDKNPLVFGTRPSGQTARGQANEFDLVAKLNRLTARERPEDDRLAARIKSYELAFRMQLEATDALDVSREPKSIHKLYGTDKIHGRQLLMARRLVERGVRVVQCYHGDVQPWDSHEGIATAHAKLGREADGPIAALLTDLAQRGLLEETLVICGGEFGRTPRINGYAGRDHWGALMSVLLAGGGVVGGRVIGSSDKNGAYPTSDLQTPESFASTIYHALGCSEQTVVHDVQGQPHHVMQGRPLLGLF